MPLPTRSLLTLSSPCHYLRNDINYIYTKPQRGVFKSVFLDFYDGKVGYPMLIVVWHYTVSKRIKISTSNSSGGANRKDFVDRECVDKEGRKSMPRTSSITVSAPNDGIRDVLVFYNLLNQQIKGLVICSNTNAEISSMCTTMCENVGEYLPGDSPLIQSKLRPIAGNFNSSSLKKSTSSDENSSKKYFGGSIKSCGPSSPRPQSKKIVLRNTQGKTSKSDPSLTKSDPDHGQEGITAVHFIWLILGRRNGSISRWLLEVSTDHSVKVMLRQEVSRGKN